MLSGGQGRAQAVEARLAATTAELQRLKAQQQKLQATNLLLEKMSQLDRRNSNPPAAVVSHGCWSKYDYRYSAPYIAFACMAANGTLLLRLYAVTAVVFIWHIVRTFAGCCVHIHVSVF